jgi:hypothetical protein
VWSPGASAAAPRCHLGAEKLNAVSRLQAQMIADRLWNGRLTLRRNRRVHARVLTIRKYYTRYAAKLKAEKEALLFEKSSKNFCDFNVPSNPQKFFGSFFQERTPSFLTCTPAH